MNYLDVLVVIPLEQELIEFNKVFPSLEDLSTTTNFCHKVDSGNAEVSMIVIQQQHWGKTHAMTAVAYMLERYDIGLIVCLGIAGGLSDDLRLGDVCYAGTVIDVLDNAKITDGLDDEATTEFSPTYHVTPTEFITALNFVRTQPELRPRYVEWQSERKEIAQKMLTEEVPAPSGGKEMIGEPNTKSGSIVCGSVVKSSQYKLKLKHIDRALLAIETESGGIFAQAAVHKQTPALTIRGICDFADKDKNRLEAATKGMTRVLAASNAASFLKLQLQNGRFLDAIKRRRIGTQPELDLVETKSEASYLSVALRQIADEIHTSLKKLSPEYKLQVKGYKLPLPRFRESILNDAGDSTELKDPADIRDIIKTHDRVLLNLPRTYPDQSMAWVIADDLMTAEVNLRQVVPIVIDGDAVRGVKFDFASLASVIVKTLANMQGVQVIFIVDNVPLAFNHRLELILNELETYPEAKFVYIAKGDSDLLSESDFSTRSGCKVFNVCSISFLEIAHFIQKNFEMTGSESEVVALRLCDTFDRFNLEAHPTYFAGIPRETLSALLQANRRAELIQLAVDGFLTFIVADDRADVALSRSTRARFLRKLVVEIHVEKRSFDEARLIEFTQEFAVFHDFDIKPIKFIQGFVDQGIMHFDANKTHISLPFIESYLLASELHNNPELAKKYFDLNDLVFDMSAFDLYAEIGASPELIASIIERLGHSSSQLPLNADEDHILLSETIAPTNMRKPGRADALRVRLKSAAKAVKDGTDKSNEKQRMLDLSDRIREESGKQRKKIRGHSSDDEKPDDICLPLSDACRHWAIATVLLGSGAEHLNASIKRELSALIVKAASAIIDQWSRFQTEIDFDGLKEALTQPETLADLPGPDDLDEKRRFVTGVLDILEYSAMADPLRKVVGFLCEQARHRVLATSVETAVPSGIVEKVIHGTWLADIDVNRGKQPLQAAIKALPRATFFRITLASHYLSRVYWNHWKKDDRLILLDAAEQAIQPLEVSLNKQELKRLIEKQAGKTDKSSRQSRRDI